MKNLHLLPTEKPSRLHLIEDTLTITSEYENSVCDTEANIYITNSEEIKDCYVLTDLDKIVKVDKSNQELYHQFNGKKIILTTDQDLINDGVQDIDDEFLLWFVSNPSCEWVETFIDTMGCTLENCDANPCINYKITIPKEEPKETIEEAAVSRLFAIMADEYNIVKLFWKKEDADRELEVYKRDHPDALLFVEEVDVY